MCNVFVEALPLSLSEVWRDRKSVNLGFSCLDPQLQIPAIMERPLKVDYPSDEDSDENQGFNILVPEVEDLINEFEKDDELIYKENEARK